MHKEQKEIEHLGYGLGLRQKHVKDIISNTPKEVDWFEIISENYFNPDSQKRKEVEIIRQDYPFVMHGVSMSIGSTDQINTDYLNNLRALSDWLEPKIISDHICWTGINKFNSHDLLPVAYTEESLKNMITKIKQVQDFLGRRIALENPSTYLEFKGSTINEWDYIRYVAEEADCNLLLDVNNVYVNCFNHNYDPKKYILFLPKERIVQIHLAGHKNLKTHIIDTHDANICDEVLELYEFTIKNIGFKNSMIEWDAEIPELNVLIEELEKVKNHSKKQNLADNKTIKNPKKINEKEEPYIELLDKFQSTLLNPREPKYKREDWIKPKESLTQKAQMDIYSSAYRGRLFDLILDEYKASLKYIGEDNFKKLVRSYIEYSPSTYFNLDDYIYDLPKFSSKYVDDISQELILLESEIFKLQDIEPASKKAMVELNFKNDVNIIYSACMNDKLNEVSPEEIVNKNVRISLTKENDGVYRKKLSETNKDLKTA